MELIEADNVEAAAREVRVTLQQAKENNLCQKCHDLDNSPEFDFDTYWDQIKHPRSGLTMSEEEWRQLAWLCGSEIRRTISI